MGEFVNNNGKIQSASSSVINHNNRAFRYGDAIFDTLRVINGKPCFLELHIERLLKSMSIIKMNIPAHYTVSFFEDQILQLLAQNQINKGGRIRITVYRNAGGFYTPETNDCSFLIESTLLQVNGYTLNEEGLHIDIYEHHKKTVNELSTIKSANCLPYILAGLYKTEKQFDDCIVLNELGNIAEAVSSNVFIVYNGVFYTPSLNQGCVGGVMRKNIIELANSQNIEVQECPLGPNALMRADEVFLCNAVQGIKWVGAYKMKRYFHKYAKRLVDVLNDKVGTTDQLNTTSN